MEDVTFEICLEDDGSDRKESACKARDPGLMPGSGRSPGEGDDNPLQYSGLENSMDCIVHGVTNSWTRLSDSLLLPFPNSHNSRIPGN